MEQLDRHYPQRPVYVGSRAALVAMQSGAREVVVDQVLLSDGQPAMRVRLLSEVVAARPPARPVRRHPGPPPPWYRRWSRVQILALVAGILAALAALVWGVIYAVSSVLSGVAAHGKTIAIILIVLVVLGIFGGGGGATFSGTFKGVIR